MLSDTLLSFWHAPDGWPLRVARFHSASMQGPVRGSLLFLNGRADFLEKYTESMKQWSNAGWLVEGFDWRGQGGSGRLSSESSVGHADDFEPWLNDLAAYVRQWRARTPPPHVLVAHSMGGHLALRGAAERRITADAIVLIAPMLRIAVGGIPHPAMRRISAMMCAFQQSARPIWTRNNDQMAWEAALRARLTHSETRFAQEQEIRRQRPGLAIDAPSWGWLYAACLSIDRMNQPGMAEHIETPVLILATRADQLVSDKAIETMARRLPQCQVHFYGTEAAHEILRETDPVRDDALARIDAFLNEAAPARRGPEGQE